MSTLFRRKSAPPGHQPNARGVWLRAEKLEDRITPVGSLFTPQTPMSFNGLNNDGCVAVTDLNKDGIPDIILANQGGSVTGGQTDNPGTGITVLLGKQAGGYTAVNYATHTASSGNSGYNVSFLAVADLNGDGFPDVVCTTENLGGTHMGSVYVFKNTGTFGALQLVGSPIPVQVEPSCIRIADVNNDNVPDLVVDSLGNDDGTGQGVFQSEITVLQGGVDPGTGKGNLTYSQIGSPYHPDAFFESTALAVGDFDRDGNVDIAAVSVGIPSDFGLDYPPGSVYFLKGNGLGSFTFTGSFTDTGGTFPTNIQAADLNGDQLPELIVANAGNPNLNYSGSSASVFFNGSPQGSIIFNPSYTAFPSNANGTFAVATADFNMDGHQDIATLNFGNEDGSSHGFVDAYLGDGHGNFVASTPATYDIGAAGGEYLDVGDFDRNGTPDIVAGGASNLVSILLNNTAAAPTVANVAVNDGTAQRSEVRSLQVTFSGPVTFAGTGTVNQNAAAAFQLQHVQNSINVANLQASVATVSNQTVVTLTFSTTGNAATEVDPVSIQGNANSVLGPSLADGRYQLTILSSKVSANGQALNGGGPSGNYVTPTETVGSTGLHLWRLYGDTTGDGVNDASDLNDFRSTFNVNNTQAAYIAALDANNDGVVDPTDLNEYRTRFNRNVF
jgi:hypothetical protein